MTPHSTHSTFNQRSHKTLQDGQLRHNMRKAMDGLMHKRANQFADVDEWARLRTLGESIRKRTLEKLPDLLETLETNLTRNGIHVHWAETTAQANAIIHGILQQHNVRSVVKGKSMVSEETHLNAFLEQNDIEILESDLGEYIIQLAEETPSHIIMPAIHKNTAQIAALFQKHIPDAPYTEDVMELTAMARDVLRKKFAAAGAGISGVNFAVAETGTLCLVENEGNGRMCTTVPPVHIAITGIDKVVENLADVPPLLSLLTRSATGQHITTYFNMISSPRKADQGEKDGPQDVHLVLLDNGRSTVYANANTRATLQCIRCGACMNHCPVYTRVGGHAYGAVYPGPIGKILTPQLQGMDDFGDLPGGSSLCNACVEVCPVKIPIAQTLVHLRNAAVGSEGGVKGAGAKASKTEAAIWKAWEMMYANPKAYGALSRVMCKTLKFVPGNAPVLKNWTSVRSKPQAGRKTLHQLAKERGLPNE
jgi:L-lactate dehydrogenase complex protein LldF